jgi:hypothetical protein
MLLGDVIARLEDETVATETLVGLNDLVLLARVEQASTAEDMTPGEYASQAVRVFSNAATDEDWVSLIGVMGQTTEPGLVCLKKMIEFALKPKVTSNGCGHHH